MVPFKRLSTLVALCSSIKIPSFVFLHNCYAISWQSYLVKASAHGSQRTALWPPSGAEGPTLYCHWHKHTFRLPQQKTKIRLPSIAVTQIIKKQQKTNLCFTHLTKQDHINVFCLNSLASGCFQGFSETKSLNAHGFAQEYLRSSSGYGPSRRVKRHGKSSSLHSKKNFCLRGVSFL